MKKFQFLFLGLMLVLPCSVFSQNYLYGDVNSDGEVNIADVNAVVGVILDNHHSNGIVGSWISEYAINENGERFDIPAAIEVSYDFYEDQTGRWGYHPSAESIIMDYVGLRWEQQARRLNLWYDDGEHEELYYEINDEGYLLLSLNAQLSQYTAYRPIIRVNAHGSKGEDNDSRATIVTKSRAVSGGYQTVE